MFIRRSVYEAFVQQSRNLDEQIITLREQNQALQQVNTEQYTAFSTENKRLKETAEQREAAHRRLSETSTRQEGNLATLLHKHEILQHKYTELSTYCGTLGTLLRNCLCYMQDVEIVAKKAGTVARLQQRTELIERAEQLGITVLEEGQETENATMPIL